MAHMTHIMRLTNLALDIQEAILFLPRVESGPDAVKEIGVRQIARVMNWECAAGDVVGKGISIVCNQVTSPHRIAQWCAEGESHTYYYGYPVHPENLGVSLRRNLAQRSGSEAEILN